MQVGTLSGIGRYRSDAMGIRQKRPEHLNQVIENQAVCAEFPFYLDQAGTRRRRTGSLQVSDSGKMRSRLVALSHGRVLFDTHNDLRHAVEALSGGLSILYTHPEGKLSGSPTCFCRVNGR